MVHFAARYNRLDVLKFAVENGCDVNDTTGSGSNALHYAVNASPDLIRFLVDECSCDSSAINKIGLRADYHIGQCIEIPSSFIQTLRGAVLN